MLLKKRAEQSANAPWSVPLQKFGSLNGCMVDGDPEQREQERRIRRWSFAISVALQSVLIIAVVIAPLFAETEKISFIKTPLPPYGHSPKSPERAAEVQSHAPRPACAFCAPTRIPPTIVKRIDSRNDKPTGDPFESGPTGPATDLIPFDDGLAHPQPPISVHENNPPKRLVIGHIQPAMLTRRIDPVYPPLAIQIRRAGRVELHAIIATDGSVQSLEVLEGDPLFIRSALDAVSQWRYKPTILNGQPVEVDTRITVIYSMPR